MAEQGARCPGALSGPLVVGGVGGGGFCGSFDGGAEERGRSIEFAGVAGGLFYGQSKL